MLKYHFSEAEYKADIQTTTTEAKNLLIKRIKSITKTAHAMINELSVKHGKKSNVVKTLQNFNMTSKLETYKKEINRYISYLNNKENLEKKPEDFIELLDLISTKSIEAHLKEIEDEFKRLSGCKHEKRDISKCSPKTNKHIDIGLTFDMFN